MDKERIYWIKHNGRRVLFADYSKLSPEDVVETVETIDRDLFPKYKDLIPNSVLALADVSESNVSIESMQLLKKSIKMWQPIYKKQAAIGLGPLHTVFLNAINKFTGANFVAFKTKEEALEWLTKD